MRRILLEEGNNKALKHKLRSLHGHKRGKHLSKSHVTACKARILDRKCRQESGCIRAYLGLGQHQPEDEQALELIIEWDPTEQLPIS